MVAKVETVSDSFNSGWVNGVTWTDTNSATPASVTANAGRIRIDHTAASEYNKLRSVASYDFTGSSAYIEVVDIGPAFVSHQVEFLALLDANNSVQMLASNFTLYAEKRVANALTTIGNITYDAVAHRWWRIRESGGTTFFDTAPDGVTWTNRFSTANVIAMTSLQPSLESGCWQAEASGSYGIFDNFNTLDAKSAPPLQIPNRYVGPMALRRNFRRADFWTPDVAVVVNNFNGTADSSVTVGLTAAGVVGVVGSDFTAVTVGLTASGVVGTSSTSTSTDVTAGLTASGSVDELHPAPPLIIPNRNVGPMALRQAFRRADWWTSPGFENLNVPSTDTVATVGLTADGVVGVVGSASTAVTVGLTAVGAVGTSGSASTAVTVGLTAAGVVGTSNTASTAVTVGLTADGVVGTSSTSTSTDLTAGLVASGSVDELHPAPPLIIPNRNVGPMALRQAFRRADPWTPDLTVVSNISGSSTDTAVTVGLTASGVVGTSSTASTAITVGFTAAGVVGTSSTASTAVTVGLTAAGAVGTTSTASTAVTVGLTAAGVVGTTSTASSAVTVAFTADGVVGLVGAAQSTDVTIGLTADGTNPANIAPAAQFPFQIPNRYVGPMALRQAFRRADPWTPAGVVSITSDTTDTAVTVGLTAAGAVGTSSASTTTAVTVTLTAAGVVGTTSTATTSVTVGLTAAGVVGTASQASTAVTVGLTAAGVVGKSSTATTSVTVGLTAAGVVGTVSQTTTSVTVGLTAAGVVGIVSQATTSVTVGLTADGFITSDQLASTAFTSVVVALTAAGGIQIFTSPKHTVTARAVALAVSANAATRTTIADASIHGSNADGSTRTGVGDATTRDTSN